MTKNEKCVVKPLNKKELVETVGGYAPDENYNLLNPKIPTKFPDLKDLIICK